MKNTKIQNNNISITKYNDLNFFLRKHIILLKVLKLAIKYICLPAVNKIAIKIGTHL